MHAGEDRSRQATDIRVPGGDEVLGCTDLKQARYAGAIIALAALWLAMLLFGGGPADRAAYEALYAGHRPALALVAHVLTTFGDPTVLIGAGIITAVWLWL